MEKLLINVKEIGLRIRKLRTSRKMTQEIFAGTIHISKSYLALIENGKRGASIDVLAQISKLYGVSVDYLLFGTADTHDDLFYRRWLEIVDSRNDREIDASLEFLENFFQLTDKYMH